MNKETIKNQARKVIYGNRWLEMLRREYNMLVIREKYPPLLR